MLVVENYLGSMKNHMNSRVTILADRARTSSLSNGKHNTEDRSISSAPSLKKAAARVLIESYHQGKWDFLGSVKQQISTDHNVGNQLFEEFVQPRVTKYGKIFKTRLLGSPTIIVNGAEANRFFLSNEFKLVISSWPTTSVQLMGINSIMEKQGEQHRFLREIIATSLGPAGLEILVPKICDSVQLYLDKNWNIVRDEISLFHSAKALTFTIVLECLLGLNFEPGTLISTFERVLEGVFAAPVSFPGSKLF
ncbi:TAXADIENE 5-ALPHA HYDROXYLASE [Salix viminalis]|uniref:TAXADIENE 5-ALPHA HYDROXYLASE n=1 Tax=Salix viminalis TaxID=40686 RepID=A0A9Q0UIM5_SALVM|nr:TAXADIENE 5-ALPHA HYDROXYLASE [Salix viminalis]